MEEYRTVLKEAAVEFIERRSRFIGSVRPVSDEGSAVAFLRSVQEKNREATHNVYAYILREGHRQRYSDDGEPQGTAGMPVLDVLRKAGLTDAVIVVTRYFGGILLGAGGLVRAYSHAASLAVRAGGAARMAACFQASLHCEYGLYGKILPLISEHGGAVDSTDFSEQVTVMFHIPCESKSAFDAELADRSCGRCSAQFREKIFYKIS